MSPPQKASRSNLKLRKMHTTSKLNFNRNLILNPPFKSHLIKIKIQSHRNDAVLASPLRMLRPSGGINLVLHHHHQYRGQIIGQYHHHHHHLNLQIVKPVIFYRMAEAEAEKREIQPPLVTEEKKQEKELPPPPEKPEAGDCCGSGCVRCVWDIYYEELEAYNQQLKDLNDSPK